MDASKLVACTFDCYGTLIDWEGGLGNFLYDYALRERWEAIQFAVIQRDYRPYRDVLADSLRLLADERGWRYSDEDGKALTRSMRSWQPFPDTAPALQAARDVYTRRGEGLSVWVVPSVAITASDPADKDMLFEPTASKIYRHPTFYEVSDEVDNM